TKQRSAGQALPWCSDGWRPYPEHLLRTYRQPMRSGRRGRPPLRLPEGVHLTQTIKHRDERGHLLRVETRATFGAPVQQPALVHVERRHGVCRDRLNALNRKTHAFAKSTTTWDALLDLHVFEQNWLHPHPALREPVVAAGPGFDQPPPPVAPRPPHPVLSLRAVFTTPPP